MKSALVFISDEMLKSYEELDENDFRKKAIKRAIAQLEQDAYFGKRIKKDQIPEYYIKKYHVTNLWKYNLPNGWRLLYTLTTDNKVEILCAILEWLSHPDYEKRCKY